MSQLPFLAAFAAAIAGLLYLERASEVRTSKALWIAVAWFCIAGSRNVSQWLHGSGGVDLGEAYVDGNPIDRNVLTSLIVAGLIVLFKRKRQIGPLLRANVPILLFFIYCGISLLWSDFPFVALKRWIRATGDIVMILVVLSDPNRLDAIKRTLARVGFILLLGSFVLIRYFPSLGRGFNRFGTPSHIGVTTDKNGLGMICMLFGLTIVWRILVAVRDDAGKRRNRQLLAHGIMLLVTVKLLLSSHSATSLACFILGSGIIWMTGFRVFRRPAALNALMVSAVIFGGIFMALGGKETLFEALGRDSTLTGRTDIWSIVLSKAENPLIGTGYETFWLGDRLAYMSSNYHGINQAHNGYLELYLNIGIAGLSLLLLIFLTGYRNITIAFRERSPVAGLRLAYLILAAIYNVTEASFKMMSPMWIMLLFSAAATPEPKRPAVRETAPPDSLWTTFQRPDPQLLEALPPAAEEPTFGSGFRADASRFT